MPLPPALARFCGDHPLLLVLAPAVQSPTYEQQMDQFADTDGDRRLRDLRIGRVLFEGESRIGDETLDDADAQAIRAHFDIHDDDFLAVLIGRDGTVKHTYDAPVASAAVFAVLDAPSSQQQATRDKGDA